MIGMGLLNIKFCNFSKYKIFCYIVLAACIIVINIRITSAAAILIISSNPSTLIENNINGAIIRLELTGESFKLAIASSDIELVKAPIGLTVSSVNFISTGVVDIYLTFNGTDFDSNISDFGITVLGSGTVSGNRVNSSNVLIIYGIKEDLSINATPFPEKLLEYNLDDSIIHMQMLGNCDFTGFITVSDILINNGPDGLYIKSLYKYDNDNYRVILGFDGTKMESDAANMYFTVMPHGNTKDTFIDSNPIMVEASKIIEGEGFFFVSGESYPDNIQIAGYNSTCKYIYVNIQFSTIKSVEAFQSAYFYYFIEVFNNSGTKIGELGSFDLPIVLNSSKGSKVAAAINQGIPITEQLNESYRIVVTVKSVLIVST